MAGNYLLPISGQARKQPTIAGSATLTRTSEVIPIAAGRLALGTWQGIFVFEHRRAPHTRSLVVSVVGS